jgi:hypothetical protein
LAARLTGSAAIGFIIPMLIFMPDDHGSAYHERQTVGAFLYGNFTPEEIARGGKSLRDEAHKLLFETKPFEIRELPLWGCGAGSHADVLIPCR